MDNSFQDIPRGQLSSIILSTLIGGDKYGYEIINDIESKTNGGLTIKQPSLYSSLKRMEDQDLISSYWMDSDIGGRRHYYRLTDYGKKQVEKWKEDLINTNNNLSNMFSNDSKSQQNPDSPIETKKPTFLEQENLFELQNKENKPVEVEKKPFEDDAVLLKNDSFIQYNLFETPTQISKANFEEQKPSTNSNNTLSNDYDSNKQNIQAEISTIQPQQEIKTEVKNASYDIYSDLTDFRKTSRSFAGSVKANKNSSQKDYKNNTLESFMGDSFVMNNLDNSLLAKDFDFIREDNMQEDKILTSNNSIENIETIEETPTDNIQDGKLITERYEEEVLPKVKKITPPNIDVFETTKAPTKEFERTYVHQSYDEKIGELYKKKDLSANSEEIVPLTISNYMNLKKYFDEQKISFNQYTKQDSITSKTSLVSDFKFSVLRYSITFFSLILSLVICFLTIRKLSYITNAELTFYFLPPILYLLFAGFMLIDKGKNKDRKVLLMETTKVQITIKIAICVVFCVFIYLCNLLGGLNSLNFNDYTNSMIVPFILTLHIPLTSLYSFLTSKIKWIK